MRCLHSWGKHGSGSRGDCGGQPPCRKASGLIRFWTATASGCAGLVACHRLSPAHVGSPAQSFRGKSSVRRVQVDGVDANIVVRRSTAVRGRGGPVRHHAWPPPWEPSCRARTGPVEADGAVDAQNAPTVPWKTLCVFHELPQGLSNQITHEKLRKAPKWRWETRIDPDFMRLKGSEFADLLPDCSMAGRRYRW